MALCVRRQVYQAQPGVAWASDPGRSPGTSFLCCTHRLLAHTVANTTERSHKRWYGAPDAHHTIARDDGGAAQAVQLPHRRRPQDAQHETRIRNAGIAGQIETAHPAPGIAHCQFTACVFDDGEFDTRAFSDCSTDVRG